MTVTKFPWLRGSYPGKAVTQLGRRWR